MNSKVNWHGRLSFTGSADTGYSIALGAEPSAGGDGDGFLPMELIAVGLAGCTAMDVISILQKKCQEVTDFEVQVRAGQDTEHPRVFNDIQIEYLGRDTTYKKKPSNGQSNYRRQSIVRY